MRKLSVVILILSLAAGAGGFFLRRYELSVAFESVSGLVKRDDMSTIWLITAAFAFLFIILALAIFVSLRYQSPEGFENTFSTYSVKYPLAFIPVSLVWIAGTVMHLAGLRIADNLQTIDIYFLVLSAFTALCSIFFSIEIYQDPGKKSPYALSLIPIIFLCFWLILVYRQNAANPVLHKYLYQCLAIVAAILSYYYTAGFLFGKPAPARALVAYSAAIFFCATTLADDFGSGISLIFLAVLAVAAIHQVLLLRNLVRKKTTPLPGTPKLPLGDLMTVPLEDILSD